MIYRILVWLYEGRKFFYFFFFGLFIFLVVCRMRLYGFFFYICMLNGFLFLQYLGNIVVDDVNGG